MTTGRTPRVPTGTVTTRRRSIRPTRTQHLHARAQPTRRVRGYHPIRPHLRGRDDRSTSARAISLLSRYFSARYSCRRTGWPMEYKPMVGDSDGGFVRRPYVSTLSSKLMRTTWPTPPRPLRSFPGTEAGIASFPLDVCRRFAPTPLRTRGRSDQNATESVIPALRYAALIYSGCVSSSTRRPSPDAVFGEGSIRCP